MTEGEFMFSSWGRVSNSWYGKLPVTELNDRFIRFAARSSGMIRAISDKPIVVRNDVQFACTDGETITLPGYYFLEKTYTTIGVRDTQIAEAAICAINGSAIHEAFHTIWTTCDIRLLHALFPGRELDSLITTKAFLLIRNITEDIFIEARGEMQFPKHSRFVAVKNELLVSSAMLREAVESFADPKEPTVEEFLSIFPLFKNKENRRATVWESKPEVVSLLEQCSDYALTEEERVDISIEIYNLLKEEGESEGQDCPSFEPGSGEEWEIDGDTGNPLSKALREVIESLTPAELAEVAKTFRKEIERADTPTMRALEGHLTENLVPTYIDILKDTHARLNAPHVISPHPEFKTFSRHFRYLTEEKSTLGMPLDRGSRIVKQRLHRIATDGKVLANYDAAKMKKGVPEVILLVDASGSMNIRDEFIPGERRITLKETVIRAAYSVFESLMSSRIPVAVYSHTTIKPSTWAASGPSPVVHGIASYEMYLGSKKAKTTHDYKNRFRFALGTDSSDNADGFALEFVAGLFTPRPGSKLLLVFSDGQPACWGGYYGDVAKDHTRLVAKSIAKSGISVISLSLTKDVVETNDEIYGHRNNVRAYAPLMTKGIQEVVMKLSHQ